MKKIAENRYPHSANLFKFCKEALALRYDGNGKIIDQDVGAILGYDPADCSHWKKGKKNIRALATLKSLADYLQIDERLLIDIAAGKMDLTEAVFEYKGYGNFSLSGASLENFKKDFFKHPEKWQQEGERRTFEELFDLNREGVARVVSYILRDRTDEAPVYLPEIFGRIPGIDLVVTPELNEDFAVESHGDQTSLRMIVRYKDSEMRPYVRYLAAKQLFLFLYRSHHEYCADLITAPEEVTDIRGNIFAGMLLIPPALLRREMEKIDSSFDVVLQLANAFWVSKSLMNKRLADYMEHRN
ncbi:MAG: hypothetical protein HYW48_07165 [Deltaproteobacteria bacterium]|nr:hypothetical protein [Deltaproteobacteria bacterium]